MFAHVRFSSLLILIGLILATDVFAAERIWDSDLKRYLTEDEINHAEVFMTEEDAVKMMLAEVGSSPQRCYSPEPGEEGCDRAADRLEIPGRMHLSCISVKPATRIDGYAMVHNTIGKHKHMTYMVGVDNRGACTDVELLVFREARGSEVEKKTIQRAV